MADDPALADFAGFDHTPYMFRITRDDGSIAYRTDLYSRCQIGGGDVNPEAPGAQWSGRRQDLDGGKSCSVVVDPDRVVADAVPRGPSGRRPSGRAPTTSGATSSIPTARCRRRLDDLVIYELHVDGLGSSAPPAARARSTMPWRCSTTSPSSGSTASS